VAVRRPKRPKGAHRPTRPHAVADPARTPMERSYAQKIRTDRPGLSFASASARASFWSRMQRELSQEEEVDMERNVAEISQGSPRANTAFRVANIEGATLASAAPPSQPSIQEQATLAGIGPDGVVPPPPPV
jgi:hypothetical protein